MSRNSSGTYTLPAGNPVVTGTTITSSWGNSTMSDIANALTDSLSRSGLGSMTAGLRLADGTSALPGLTWGTELTSGVYRAGSGDFRWVIGTVEQLALTTSQFRVVPSLFLDRDSSNTAPTVILQNNRPNIQMWEDDAAANNGRWQFLASTEAFVMQTLSDDTLTAVTFLQIDRTATVVDTINFASGVLQYGGIEVGYRGMPRRDISGDGNTAASDNGCVVVYTGTGGHTFTVDSDFGVAFYIMNVINSGTGTLTLAETLAGSMFWFNATGAPATGSRTLAIGGVATLYMSSAASVWVWGSGLS